MSSDMVPCEFVKVDLARYYAPHGGLAYWVAVLAHCDKVVVLTILKV